MAHASMLSTASLALAALVILDRFVKQTSTNALPTLVKMVRVVLTLLTNFLVPALLAILARSAKSTSMNALPILVSTLVHAPTL
jgi:hypothetical protein